MHPESYLWSFELSSLSVSTVTPKKTEVTWNKMLWTPGADFHAPSCQHNLFIPAQFFACYQIEAEEAPYISQLILLLQNKASKLHLFLNNRRALGFCTMFGSFPHKYPCWSFLTALEPVRILPTLVRFLKAFQFISEAWGRKLISFTVSILNPDLCPLTSS